MSKPITIFAVLAATVAASGCGTVSQIVGAGKQSPDEFRVVTAAPLTLPPDYSLRPPRPGDARPQERDPDAEARAALFGEEYGAAATQGERAFVGAAGADAVDPGIRDQIDYESQGVIRRSEGFVDRLLAFGGQDAPATPLNAEDEAERLERDEAIRRATGGGDVTIERDRGFKLPGT